VENFISEGDFDKEFEINCCFAMVSGVGFLVESSGDEFSMKNAIKIKCPNLERILFSMVPALGVSELSYLCNGNIVGTIRKSGYEKFCGEIVDIKKLDLTVSGLNFMAF